MAAPIIRWFVETAGTTGSLSAYPENWQELSSREYELIFGSNEYSSTKIFPVEKSDTSEVVPACLFLRRPTTSSFEYVKIENWSRYGEVGRYVLAAKFESRAGETAKIVGYPRLEAWDYLDQADINKRPSSELLTGTAFTGYRPFIKAVDVTNEVVGFSPLPGHPTKNWWEDSLFGTSSGRIKDLVGTGSYLECSTIVKPTDGEVYIDDTGVAYSGSTTSDTFYFSVASTVPPDAYRGMKGHDVVISVRVNSI